MLGKRFVYLDKMRSRLSYLPSLLLLALLELSAWPSCWYVTERHQRNVPRVAGTLSLPLMYLFNLMVEDCDQCFSSAAVGDSRNPRS